MRWLSRFATHRLFWPALVLVVTLFVLSRLGVQFVGVHDGHLAGSLVDVFNRGSQVMLLAVGMTLVIATGGIDLSVGAVMAICGAVSALLLTEYHLSLAAVFAAALAAGLLCGFWNGALVAWFGVQPIIATLILMVAGRGVAQLITGGQILTIGEDVRYASYRYLGSGYLLGLPVSIWLALLVALVIGALVGQTNLRLSIESIGGNPVASRVAGVPVSRVRLLVYVVLGLCSALAGLLYTSNITAADANNTGLYLELDAILAVVIGGTSLSGGRFSLIGTLLGALVVQALTTTIFTSSVSPHFALVVKALVVVIVCLLQSPAFRNRMARLARWGKR